MATDEPLATCGAQTLGGRKTLPFIIASTVGVGVGAYTVAANLGVYLIDEYNFEPVDSILFTNIVSGFTNFAPFVAAIVFDTCILVSCFAVISAACVASALGMLLLTLTAALPCLRPTPCTSGPCQGPATWQVGVLYAALALMTVGLGGTRFTAATLGAAQLDDEADRDAFFSWYVVGMYASSIIGITGVVYVQENSGRGIESSEHLLACNKLDDGANESQSSTDRCLRCTNLNGSNDLATLLRLAPLITTGIVLILYIAVQMSVSFLQALVMDCRIGSRFSVPVGSMPISLVVAATVSIPLLNHVVYPACRSLAGRPPSPLHRIGLGFLITTLAMVYGATIETKRLESLQSSAEAMSVLWLVPLYALVGLGEALYIPGQLAFFYQEFPESLKGSGTAVSALQSGIGSFLASAMIDLIRRFSNGWIDDDANVSRLDKLYWMLASIGMLNLGCFVVYSRIYGQKKGEEI